MNVSVIGCGRWGSFLAWYLNNIGHNVILYGRDTSDKFIELQSKGKNEYVNISSSIQLNSDLGMTLKNDYIFLSINAQNLRNFMNDTLKYNMDGKKIVLCMKGLEENTGKRLSEIVREVLGTNNSVLVWAGPGHIQSFISGIPNCMVIDSDDSAVKKEMISLLNSKLIRFYIGNDLVGNEIGAAMKNVYGIAAGMLDGLGYGSLKGALIVRSAVEVSRLIKKLGGDQRSTYGLSFLGECETTFFSQFSNNKIYGENFINKVPNDKLCEGTYTLRSAYLLSEKMNIEMPICNVLYSIIYDNHNAKKELVNLLLRSTKGEFDTS